MDTIATGLNIPQETREKVKKYLDENHITFYWDYRDRLTLEQVQMLLEGRKDEVIDDIWENSLDWLYDQEISLMESLKEELPELVEFENTDLRDEFLEDIQSDFDIEQLIRNTPAVRIRVEVMSNFEGFGWTDRNAGGLNGHPYIRQIRRLMKGKYTQKSWDQEVDNVCSSCCRLIFYFQTDVKNLMEVSNTWKTITIPKEAWAGFYDSWNGSGSVLEIKLTEDVMLPRKHGKTIYDTVEIILDEANKYSVEETYGLCNVPEITFNLK